MWRCLFDGKTLTLLGKNHNVYTQLDVPGTVDHLIDELRDTYQKPLPAADLLLSNPYDALMLDVFDIKDLGSGVVGGVECDFLAFRTDEVDWQIWIAQGKRPFPYRYVITSKKIGGGPQYSIQISLRTSRRPLFGQPARPEKLRVDSSKETSGRVLIMAWGHGLGFSVPRAAKKADGYMGAAACRYFDTTASGGGCPVFSFWNTAWCA